MRVYNVDKFNNGKKVEIYYNNVKYFNFYEKKNDNSN